MLGLHSTHRRALRAIRAGAGASHSDSVHWRSVHRRRVRRVRARQRRVRNLRLEHGRHHRRRWRRRRERRCKVARKDSGGSKCKLDGHQRHQRSSHQVGQQTADLCHERARSARRFRSAAAWERASQSGPLVSRTLGPYWRRTGPPSRPTSARPNTVSAKGTLGASAADIALLASAAEARGTWERLRRQAEHESLRPRTARALHAPAWRR
jgi:hypothetical protein